MKNLSELLSSKTVNILINICKKYNLRGYSNLKKEGLINLILQNINNPQVSLKIRTSIKNNATTVLIFKSIVDNNNEESYTKLREEILKNRTSSTFRWYYRLLTEDFILFEDDWSDDDTVYLPKEFSEIAQEVINEHFQDEEPESTEISDEEEKEAKIITALDQLLYSKKYTNIEFLKDNLKFLGKSYSGNKSEIIERLLYETEATFNEIVGELFSKNELSDICRDFDLPVSGTKDVLIERILSKFPPEKSKISISPPVPPSLDSEEAYGGMASGGAESEIEVSIEKELKIKEEKMTLINLFKATLEIIPLYPSNFKSSEPYRDKQKRLENAIETTLGSFIKADKEKFKDIELEKMNNPNHPNIKIIQKNEKLGVSIWFFESSTTMSKIKNKVFDYKSEYGKNVIFYIYDPLNKFKIEDLDKLKNEALAIYKTNRDFE